jgi:hypothetical protein
LIGNGIRSGAGLGFPIQPYNNENYWTQFIFEWVFYFTIILVMLNIINGIIVDTFQAMRQENIEKVKQRDDLCYICSKQKGKFEASGVSFKRHTKEEHNILSYLQYILMIKNKNRYDMKSIEYYVYDKVQKNIIDFFPIGRAKSLDE